MNRFIRFYLSIIAGAAIAANVFHAHLNAGGLNKRVTAKVDAIAKDLRDGKMKSARQRAKAAIKEQEEIYEFMLLLNLRRRRGVGYGDGSVNPDGIERKIQSLARSGITKEDLKKEKAALNQMAYRLLAVGHLTLESKTELPPRFQPIWINSAQYQNQSTFELLDAVKKLDSEAVQKTARRIDVSCNNCHNLFRAGGGARILPLKKAKKKK